MVVRSFLKNEFDIIRKGPYEVRIRDQNYQSDYFPSPYVSYYSHRSFCHIHSSADIQLDNEESFYKMEMSSKFGCCTRYEENPKSLETNEQLEEDFSLKCSNISRSNPIPLLTKKGNESHICFFPYPLKKCSRSSVIERADVSFVACKPCPQPSTTTVEISTVAPVKLFKRSAHGGLMVMTNFCLQPLVIYIARFYKETFNERAIKGVKVWYWVSSTYIPRLCI